MNASRPHVSPVQPLAHLFTVPIPEVMKRAATPPRKPRKRPAPSVPPKESAE